MGLFKRGGLVLGVATALIGVVGTITYAQNVTRSEGFALQVSPATLVDTVKPGQKKTLDLRIENQSVNKETLQIQLREFNVDKKTGEIDMLDTEPVGVGEWVTFSDPIFTLDSGEAMKQEISVNLPQETGFAYSFAVVISRTSESVTERGTTLSGSVAVFALINVDRPGATRSLEITDVSVPGVLEYLPADIDITFYNSGNTFVQPAGNVFIQRGSNDSVPIATVPVNDKKGYLLPDTPRTMTASWNDGFPVYESVTDADGQQRRELVWDWSKIADFRIGHYVAKVVAVYDDGERDIPVVREVSFWVIPWRIILFALAVVVVLGIGFMTIWRNTHGAVKRKLNKSKKN